MKILFQDCNSNNQPTEHSVDEGEDQMTTSQLISLDDKLVAQKMQEESGIISSSQSPPIQLSPETRRGPPVSSSEKTKRGEMISLPSDFLRPPGWISAEEKNIKNQALFSSPPFNYMRLCSPYFLIRCKRAYTL
eukprot:195354_1